VLPFNPTRADMTEIPIDNDPFPAARILKADELGTRQS
jgi:hypothetical protein